MTEFTKRLDRVTVLRAGAHPAPNGEFMATLHGGRRLRCRRALVR